MVPLRGCARNTAPMSTETLALLASPPLIALGAWMVVRGRRGRPIPTVRECARCLHEVDPAASPTACPECGNDLTAPRAARNRRMRSMALTVVGVWLLSSGLSGVGFVVWQSLSKTNPWPSVPTGVLSLVLSNGPASLADKAAAEFATRLSANALSDAKTRSLAAEIATRIEDPNRPWNRAWDPLASTLRVRGLIPDATWGEFFARGIDLALLAPEKARSESRIQYGFTSSTRPFQFGQLGQLVASLRLTLSTLRIGGADIGDDRRTGLKSQEVIDGSGGSSVTQLWLPEIPSGPSMIEAEFSFEILDGGLDSEKVLVMKTLRLTKPITIVGKDDPILEVVRDASLREAFRSAITLRSAKLRLQPGKRCMVDLSFDIGRTPVGAAFRVFLRRRDGGASPSEFELIPLAITGANPVPNRGLAGFVDEFAPGRYDIVLRPSLEHAEEMIGLTRVWLGEDIVIEDIVIEDVELAPDEVSEPASPSPE
jgi:hypothetical protein